MLKLTIILGALSLLLTGCLKPSSANKKSPNSQASSFAIKGNVVLGIVQDAKVTLYPILSSGALNLASPLASTRTDINGNYTLSVQGLNNSSNPMGVQVTDGSYEEEASGERIWLRGKKLTAVIPSLKTDQQTIVAIGPLSDIAYQLFQSRLQAQGTQGKSLAQNANDANEQVSQTFGVNDIIKTLPANPSGILPNGASGKYTIILAALSHSAQVAGTDSTAISDAYAKHLIQDGDFSKAGQKSISVTNASGETVQVNPPTIATLSNTAARIVSKNIVISGLEVPKVFSAPKLDAFAIDKNTTTTTTTTTNDSKVVACSQFTYSAYGACQPHGQQSRNLLSSSPASCTGGTPVTSQSCIYVPPVVKCSQFTYSAYGACQPHGQQSRNLLSSSPAGCSGGAPVTSQACTYVKPVVTCSQFTYSAYGACQPHGKQSRNLLSSSPANCTGGTPVTSQSCVYIPPAVAPSGCYIALAQAGNVMTTRESKTLTVNCAKGNNLSYAWKDVDSKIVLSSSPMLLLSNLSSGLHNYSVTVSNSTSSQILNQALTVNASSSASTIIRDGAYSGGYYAYAPGVVDLGGSVIFFSCHGPEGRPNQIEDEIFLDQGSSSSQVFVRGSHNSPVAWDSNQICDPNVIKGNFKYNGISYGYALFYTGASIAPGISNLVGANNQVGVAFTNNLKGSSWVRYIKPLVGFQPGHIFGAPSDGAGGEWGVGQPSAIKLSGSDGRVLLFYTRGNATYGTHTSFVNVDLSNFSDTTPPSFGNTQTLNDGGLKDLRGSVDIANNIDVAYDPQVDRYYAIREKHYNMAQGLMFPPVSEVGGQGNIVSSLELISISGSDFAKNNQWTVEGKIDSSDSGNFLNHNAGLRRDLSGNIPQSGTVEVYYTSGCKVSDGVAACDAWQKWFFQNSILAKSFSVSGEGNGVVEPSVASCSASLKPANNIVAGSNVVATIGSSNVTSVKYSVNAGPEIAFTTSNGTQSFSALPAGNYTLAYYGHKANGTKITCSGGSNITVMAPAAPAAPVDYTPIGKIDSVTTTAISGWACSKNSAASITVHLYVGGLAGSGTYIAWYNANLASEPAIASAINCNSTGSAYRFSIPITTALQTQYADRPIYVYGINPFNSGAPNALLINSGNFKMPSVPMAEVNTCSSFTYSAYGVCQSNNTQSRNVISSSPANCTGGSPATTQACAYSPPITAYKFSSAESNNVLSTFWAASNVLDGNPGTSYSSKQFAGSVGDGYSHLVAYLFTEGGNPASKINLHARMFAGAALGFPASYDVYVTDANNTAWVLVGTYNVQPSSSGVAVVSLGKVYLTQGVMIVPRTLGKDDNGNYYFQLADIEMAP